MIQNNWQSLIKAERIEFKPGNGKNVVNVKAGPLERGFGLTLGNALRRILLSSIQGAAVTAIRIEGVLHEFTSVPGVKEDVTDIVLNVKNLVFKANTDVPKTLTLEAKGPGPVTAGDIAASADYEVADPSQVICTLNDEATVKMEFIVKTGRGYVPASENRDDTLPLGFIPIDSIYSPIKRVAYRVEDTRVGQSTDYNNLLMEVETDGSVQVDDALAFAARILTEQMKPFINFDEPQQLVQEKDDFELPFNKNLLRKVDELELSVRSMNCLRNENIIYIGDLVCKSENELLRTPNFGRKSLNEIKEVLSHMGIDLGMEVPDWPPENVEELAKQVLEEPY